MCECLSYEDGAEYLCEACGPRWREYEASIQRRPVTAPAPLDAAVEEARKAQRLYDSCPAEAKERLEKALRLVLTDYRTEGCGDPTCAVCARSAAAKAEARAALAPPADGKGGE